MIRTHLPQELMTYIIGLLDDDHDTLKQCGLVCRVWASATRSHLFRSLSISSTNRIELTDFLRLAGVRILPHIKRLNVRDITLIGRSRGETQCRGGVNFLVVAALGQLGDITELYLENVEIDIFSELTHVISILQQLQSIHLIRVRCKKWNAPHLIHNSSSSPLHPLPAALTQLAVHDCNLRGVFAWLLSLHKLPSLSNFSAGPLSESTSPIIGSFLARACRALKHISFSFLQALDAFEDVGCFGFLDISPPDDTDLAHFKRPLARRLKEVFHIDQCPYLTVLDDIRTVHIQTFIDSRLTHQTTAWCWAPALLSSIGGSKVRRIVLGLHLQRAGEVDQSDINWEFFDDAFVSDAAYPSLRVVEFQIYGRANPDGVASLLGSRLPKSASRGLLKAQRHGVT